MERRQTGSEPQDPRNNTMVSFQGFLFASYISNLVLRKPETQMLIPVHTHIHLHTHIHTPSPNRNLFFIATAPKKASKAENFYI